MQWLANEFLDYGYFQTHIHELQKKLESHCEQLVTSLNNYLHDKVEFTVPHGGIHLWCKVKKDVEEMKLLENAIKRGVIYVPGSVMGSGNGYVRFTYARAREEEIREGVRRFAEALTSLKK